MSFWCRRTDVEAPILWPPDTNSWLTGKDPDAGRDWRQEETGTTEDEIAGWHHRLDGRESEWTPGVGDGQGGLACWDSLGCRVGHDWVTKWTELREGRLIFQSWVKLYESWEKQRSKIMERPERKEIRENLLYRVVLTHLISTTGQSKVQIYGAWLHYYYF